MFQSSDSDYERQKTLHTLMPGTYPIPVKQIITEANPVETPDKQAVLIGIMQFRINLPYELQ